MLEQNDWFEFIRNFEKKKKESYWSISIFQSNEYSERARNEYYVFLGIVLGSFSRITWNSK